MGTSQMVRNAGGLGMLIRASVERGGSLVGLLIPVISVRIVLQCTQLGWKQNNYY